MTKQEIKRAKNNLRKIQAQVWLKKRKKLRFVLSCVAVIVLIYFSWNLINKADIHLDMVGDGRVNARVLNLVVNRRNPKRPAGQFMPGRPFLVVFL